MVTNGNFGDNTGRLFICSNTIRTTNFFFNSQQVFFGLNCRPKIRVYVIDLLYSPPIFFTRLI